MKSEVMREFWRKHQKDLIIGGVLLVISVVFVLIFSISTSPFYKDYYAYGGAADGGDSLHFQSDGQNWLNGKVPYRDFFDHKGPIIFLVNMIGWWLGGNSRFGIVVLQVISLTITLFYVWKISQLAKKSTLWGAISVLLTLIFITNCYNVGNTVQEYNLPFIAVALYYLVRYFYQKKLGEHNPWRAFVYGISIGACLLLQVTHAIPICAGVLVIFVILITQKRWKNLWANLGMGLAGIAVMWLPFALYFLLNGAFGDFIYCTIAYNFGYAGNIGSWLHDVRGIEVRDFLVNYVPFFCALGAAILAWARKRRAYAMMLVITFLLEAYLFLSGSNYPQYVLPTICQVGMFLNEVILFEHKDEARKILFVAMIALLTLVAYNQILSRAETLTDQYNAVRAAGANGIGYEKLMKKYEGKLRESSFSAYGANDLKGIYVRYRLIPKNKFFVIQNWCASFTDKIKDETYDDFANNHAEYLLVDENEANSREYGIQPILEEYYKILERDGKYVMYQLKE